jgi:Flp pilus assembly protein TadG
MNLVHHVRAGLRALRDRIRAANRPGQAIVEFALIAPILLLMIFGLVDFARAWAAHHAISDAAREGARMLVMYNENITEATTRDALEDRLRNAGLDPASATILLGTDAPRGQPREVSIAYPFRLMFVGPFLGLLNDGDRTLNLQTRVAMRVE